MLYKTRDYGFDPTRYICYQSVVDCTNWPVVVSFNNWDIIQFTIIKTSSENFDGVNKVVLDGISDKMASLLQLGNYGDIN